MVYGFIGLPFRVKVQGVGFGIWNLGFGVWNLGFGNRGLGSRV